MKKIFVLLLFPAVAFCNLLSDPAFSQLMKLSSFSTIRKLALNLALDFSDCASDIKFYVKSLTKGQEWALQMFDSTSKIQPGILKGNIYGLGNFDECLEINSEMDKRRIKGKYCLGQIPLPLDFFLSKKYDIRADFQLSLKYGLCIPSSCGAEKLNSYINTLLNTLNVSIQFSNDQCYTTTNYEFTTLDLVATIIFGIILAIILVGSLYDVYLQKKNEKANCQILLAFSLYTNVQQLFKTKSVDKNGQILHSLVGIRFLSMAWIIYAHTLFVAALYPVMNYVQGEEFFRSLPGQLVVGSSVTVDTFLVMSGTLVAYTLLNQFKKGIKFKDIPMIYLHRYIRLTPAYVAMILFQISLAKYFGSGPIWYSTWERVAAKCTNYWWTSLLYIQNYYNPNSNCLGQTWYLSVDMQLFSVAPILLIFFKKYKRLTYPVLVMCALLTSFVIFLVSYHYRILASMATGSADMLKLRQAQIYVPTHARAGPWFIGVALGYFLHRHRGTRIIIKPWVVVVGWVTTFATIFAVLLGMYPFVQRGYKFNPISDPSYAAFHRLAWAFAIVWMIFACENGYGGVINKILTTKLFQPLGKLTYCQYLVHYLFQSMMASSVRVAPYYTPFDACYKFISDLVISLILAAVLSLTFESPMIKIEKIIFGTGKSIEEKKFEKCDDFGKENLKNYASKDRFEITKF